MDVDIRVILMVCTLVFFGGFVDSIAGGGGLISLPAYVASGIPYHTALGSNKFSSSFGTIIASIRYIKNKKVHLKTALFSIAFAFVGSSLGAQAVQYISADFLRKMLIFTIPMIAIFILMKKDFGQENNASLISLKRAVLYSSLAGLVIGFYDGFFGPGTGAFLILIYTVFLKFDMLTASGNAKLINLSSNIAAVVMFLIHGQVNFYVAVPAAVCGIAGNYIGSGMAIKNGAKVIKPVLVLVLGILIAKILVDTFGR